MSDTLLTVKEAAAMLGVSSLTLRNWDKSGKFEAKRHPLNNYRVYKLADVESLIEEIKAGGWNTRVRGRQVKKLQVKHLED